MIVERVVRMAFDRLPAGAREGITRRRAAVAALTQVKRNSAVLARRLAELELTRPPVDRGPGDPRFPGSITSRMCTQAQLGEHWYRQWCTALGEQPRANRKLWEHAYIAHALDSLDQLRAGRRGLAFGVGREPLVALFAARGCQVLATDLPEGAEEARGWSNANQHAGCLEGLMRPELCDPVRFRDLVEWRSVDMRLLPADLRGFDFCWSACSLEHLGSLEAGLRFVRSSLTTLAPGGVAVHTTELNVGSGDATLTRGRTVLYRPRDLRDLARELEDAGHDVAVLELDPGTGVLDEYVDLPPYAQDAHLRVWYKRFTTTSVALVIRAAANTARARLG